MGDGSGSSGFGDVENVNSGACSCLLGLLKIRDITISERLCGFISSTNVVCGGCGRTGRVIRCTTSVVRVSEEALSCDV